MLLEAQGAEGAAFRLGGLWKSGDDSHVEAR